MNNQLTAAQLASADQVRRYAMERELIARQVQSAPAETRPGESVRAEWTTPGDPAVDDAGTPPD